MSSVHIPSGKQNSNFAVSTHKSVARVAVFLALCILINFNLNSVLLKICLFLSKNTNYIAIIHQNVIF